ALRPAGGRPARTAPAASALPVEPTAPRNKPRTTRSPICSRSDDVVASGLLPTLAPAGGAVPVLKLRRLERAQGMVVMPTVALASPSPKAFRATSRTTYCPVWLYWWTGFCSVEVRPSPKSHRHPVGFPE